MDGLYDELMIALHSIWRRRWLALVVGWGIALAGWLVVSFIPNTYRSEARILIQARSMLSNAVGMNAAERQQNIDSVRQSLTSAANLERVVRETDLSHRIASQADLAGAVATLAKAIKVTPEQDNLFKVSAASSDTGLSDAQNAKMARQIVQKLIDLFIDGNMTENRVETGQTLDFLDKQIDARGRQLAEAEARRSEFEQKYMALLPGVGTIADRIAAARSEMARIDGELAAANSGVAAVRGQMASTPAATRTPGSVIAGAPSASGAIQAQIAEGRARGWTDQHPDMVALRDQLARSGGGTVSRVGPATVTPNPMYVSLRSMLAEKQAVAGALAARKSQIQGQINAVIAQQAANPRVAAEQTELDRNYQVLKAQYDKLLADREDVKLRGDVQSTTAAVKFSVIDPPSAPQSPAVPNRPMLLTAVLLLAAGGGCGAAFAMSALQGSFPTAARLAKASGLPVLGSIHQVQTAGQAVEAERRMRIFKGGAAALAALYMVLMAIELVQRSMVA